MAVDDVWIVTISWPSDAGGKLAAFVTGAVERGVAACGQIVPGIRSIYRWQGTIEDQPELLVVMKTTRQAYPALQAYILGEHPYQVPEIVAVPAVAGNPSYLAWVADSLAEGARLKV